MNDFLEQQLWLAPWHFSNSSWEGQLKNHPLILPVKMLKDQVRPLSRQLYLLVYHLNIVLQQR